MRQQTTSAILLAIIASAIWISSLPEWKSNPEIVLISLLLPVMVYVARANKTARLQRRPVPLWTLFGFVSLTIGFAVNSMFLMAIGWGSLAIVYLAYSSSLSGLRLLVLFVAAFPWIVTDLQSIGWWFRLSGADVTGRFFTLLGLAVEREGTVVRVDGLPISVEAACSGLQLLQLLISGGICIAAISFPVQRRFWLLVAALPFVAWSANTARIILVSIWGLSFGIDAAQGIFHTWGGLFVIALTVGGTLVMAGVLTPTKAKAG